MTAQAVAVYERRVAASPERVWENVLDWEHLPALHGKSFGAIRCEEAGNWGWRARVTPARSGEDLTIELTIDWDDSSYHSRTIDGPGAGTDIFTRVRGVDPEHTDVRVEFFVPGLDATSGAEAGRSLVRLYTRLWDEDESMMQGRQAFLDRSAPGVARRGQRERVALGPAQALSRAGAQIVDVEGEPFRVLWHEGGFVAHSTVCPHWGGPLGSGRIEAGSVVCPWHGYRFDLTTGAGPDGQSCRLLARARVEVDGAGDAWILVS